MRVDLATGQASPMRGQYLVTNPAWNGVLRVSDAILALTVPRSRAKRLSSLQPRRVLVGIGGHMGDAVIATGAVALLRRLLPHAEMGVVTGSWARVVLEGHPAITHMHTLDHWKPDRSSRAVALRWMTYRRQLWEMSRVVRRTEYDLAIDLYPYYPNMAELMWRSDIPTRIGWMSGGFGDLYTHAYRWQNDDIHTLEQHARLIDRLGLERSDQPLSYDLPPIPQIAVDRVEARLRSAGIASSFIVVHTGAGTRQKEWPIERWELLVHWLSSTNQQMVFSGTGARHAEEAARLTAVAERSANLVDAFGWAEFVHLLRRASLVITVDTVAAHVAGAVGTPCVAIHTGINNPAHWRPLGSRSIVVTRSVPCSPCYRRDGCAAMQCIRDVTVDDVIAAARVVA